MTLKELKSYLRYKYIPVSYNCKQVQEKLLSLGCHWWNGCEKIMDVDCNYIYIDGGYCMSDVNKIKEGHSKYNLISPKDLYSLELTEPLYRPFYDLDECYREMIKHQPFGYLMHELEDSMIAIDRIDMSYQLMFWIGAGKRVYSPTELFNSFKFMDGSPFGIIK